MQFLSLAVLVIVSFCAVFAQNNGAYTSKYDNIDVDKILNNQRVLTNYIKCLMDEGPCTPDGRELKKTLPDALASDCAKCNDKQKATTEKVIRHLMTRRTKDWDKLTKKYDPQGVYKQKYEQELAKSA